MAEEDTNWDDEPLSDEDFAINKLEDAAKGARDCLQSVIKLNIPRQLRRLEEALENIKKI